jgi:hypothetical protein
MPGTLVANFTFDAYLPSYVKVFAAWAEKVYNKGLPVTFSYQDLSALIFISQVVNLLLAVGITAAIFYHSLKVII